MNNNISLYTIGSGRKSAETFFTVLRQNNIKILLDVRLNNNSQLAGFSKKDDLIFFLRELCGCAYEHLPQWAPTKKILDEYKNKVISWTEYEEKFNEIIKARDITKYINKNTLNQACLLCSEATPEQCHRRLLAECFKMHFKNVKICHL